VVSFTPLPLYPQGKNPWYPSDWRMGGPQSRFGRGGEEKNSQPPPGIEPYNLDRPARRIILIIKLIKLIMIIIIIIIIIIY
jgi:hypothetical protein